MTPSPTKIALEKPGTKGKRLCVLLLTAGLFLASLSFLDIDMVKFFERLGNTPDVFRRMFGLNLSVVPDILKGALVSL